VRARVVGLGGVACIVACSRAERMRADG